MPYFLHDGLKFHYRSAGEGVPFIFQHGLGADLRQPFDLFSPPPGIRLLAFDFRGHGRTEPMGDAAKVSLRHFALDLKAFMKSLRIDQAMIGGISLGAAVAVEFATRFPARVRALVLVRPAWVDRPNPYNVRHFLLIARLLRQAGARQGRRLFKTTSEYHEARRRWPDVAESFLRQFSSPGAHRRVARLEKLMSDAPAIGPEQWRNLRFPVLVIATGRDPVHPLEYGKRLAGFFPLASFRRVTSKSTSLEKHRSELQRAIGNFLENQTAMKPFCVSLRSLRLTQKSK